MINFLKILIKNALFFTYPELYINISTTFPNKEETQNISDKHNYVINCYIFAVNLKFLINFACTSTENIKIIQLE